MKRRRKKNADKIKIHLKLIKVKWNEAHLICQARQGPSVKQTPNEKKNSSLKGSLKAR